MAAELVDVETAKLAGRANFSEMVRYLKAHPQVGIVLVEKTDRLYRNLKDWVIRDELEIAIHLVKEGVVLSSESKSSEWLHVNWSSASPSQRSCGRSRRGSRRNEMVARVGY